jgi:ribosomal-protein-alanine N-acetyltransferase
VASVVPMNQYHVRALTASECDAIGTWRYPGRYATYAFDDGPPDPADGFFGVADGDRLVGYCCFGPEARVPGVEEVPGVVDVGYGMDPALVGQGRARPFVAAILDFAARQYTATTFRALVLDWNDRSRAACRNAGFAPAGEVVTDVGRFVVFERPVG